MAGSLLPMPAPVKFVIVTRGRTGSNLLVSLLNSHPRIRIYGEVVGEAMMRTPSLKKELLRMGALSYVCRFFKRYGFESAAGVKFLYYQLESDYGQRWHVTGLPDIFNYLTSQNNIKVIHVKRKNRLECLASIRVAAHTNTYTVSKEAKVKSQHNTIFLSPEECEQEFELIGQWEATYDEAFLHHEKLDVYYEELVDNMQVECDRVLKFLGVEKRNLFTSFKKQQSRPLSLVVSNFYELAEKFSGTKWSKYFE